MTTPANNLGHAILKQMNIRANGTLLTKQSDTYHLKAYIQTLLNHNRTDRDTVLAATECAKDKINSPSQYTADNIKGPGVDEHAESTVLSDNHKDHT